ncbi:hypothetical protein ILUMI_15393 [Ignelater luminosus]|uniref:Uncharacterized protein n=1 Tax=Ignelater luminosus TaxID=2038154 RepID=A0A8K0CNQ5_IGNLU|nr:hypothetical protein ILUMI_15393 [Ignelater luminosus]
MIDCALSYRRQGKLFYIRHSKGTKVFYVMFNRDQLGSVLKAIGAHDFLPHNRVLGIVGNVLCRDESITQILCTNSLFAIAGYNDKQMNTTLLPIIMRHTPAAYLFGNIKYASA